MTTFGLDLSSQHIRDWHALLPLDIRSVVSPDAAGSVDESLAPVVTRFASATPDRFLDLIVEHDAILSAPDFGQARRVRLMAWVLRTAWPDSSAAMSLVASAQAGEEGDAEAGAGTAGGAARRVKGRFPVLFLEDYRRIESVVRPRIARSVSDAETVEALANGLRNFERSGDGPSGML